MSKLTTLDQLKMLAQRSRTEIDKVDTKVDNLAQRVDDIATVGGESNVITEVKVNGTALAISDKAVDIPIPGYTVEKAADSGEYAAIYQFKRDGVAVGAAINIPKDMVVQEGSVVTDPDGQAAGTYIKLVLQNVDDPLFINVGDLIEYVTSGSADGDMVFVTVDPVTHKVTAAITEAKLDAALKTKIDNKVDKADITMATNTEVTAMLDEVFGGSAPTEDEEESGT